VQPAMKTTLLLVAVVGLAGCEVEPAEAPAVDPLAFCENGVRDERESDVDCGGACAPCDAGRFCSFAQDCESKDCVAVALHPDGVEGQCWGADYSGCTVIAADPVAVQKSCGERIAAMCQTHLPAAMLDRCDEADAKPLDTTAHIVCCDADLF
jgi:hypothetical protein